MKKLLLLFIVLTTAFAGNVEAQISKNMNLLGKYVYPSGRGNLSDVWGYQDTTGKEYALVGVQRGFSIVDVTNPASPQEVFYLPGANTIWRDIKTWGKYAYVTNEGDSGLLIVDMSTLPNATGIQTKYYKGSSYPFTTAHNLYIDEKGFCYLFGADYLKGGAIVLDVKTNPWNPVEVGLYDTYYFHDGMARGDTLWGSAINDGFLIALDVSNKSNIVPIGNTQTTPLAFTHNAWVTDDNSHIFTTDEKSNAFIASYDVTNMNNITEVDRVQSQNPNSGVIVHNVHVDKNFLVTSYYRDGVTVHDITHPNNMILVGWYDTSPLSGNNFNGCWGAYPWLPSGNILGTDIEEGLFILGRQFKQGCYLEGTVTDFGTSALLSNVLVEILPVSNNISTTTNVNGFYRTGIADSAMYDIAFSKGGYFPDTVKNVLLDDGVITTLNHQLVAMVPFTLNGQVLESTTNTPIANADVILKNQFNTYNVTTNGSGQFSISNFFEGNYDIVAGKWNFKTKCYSQQIFNSNPNVTILLDSGIYDDFTFNNNWVVTGSATAGIWERGIPNGTSYNTNNDANPAVDVSTDCTDKAFVTGNQANAGVGDDDVDGGITILTSPTFDLTNYVRPSLNYTSWFFNDGGFGTPNDSMVVYLDNGSTRAVVEVLTASSPQSAWIGKSFKINDFITPTSTMKVIVTASDFSPGHLVEAGFDHFFVVDTIYSGINEGASLNAKIYPNPFNDKVIVEGLNNFVKSIIVTDITGKQIHTEYVLIGENRKEIRLNVSQGMYLIQLKDAKGNVLKTEKIIRQ